MSHKEIVSTDHVYDEFHKLWEPVLDYWRGFEPDITSSFGVGFVVGLEDLLNVRGRVRSLIDSAALAGRDVSSREFLKELYDHANMICFAYEPVRSLFSQHFRAEYWERLFGAIQQLYPTLHRYPDDEVLNETELFNSAVTWTANHPEKVVAIPVRTRKEGVPRVVLEYLQGVVSKRLDQFLQIETAEFQRIEAEKQNTERLSQERPRRDAARCQMELAYLEVANQVNECLGRDALIELVESKCSDDLPVATIERTALDFPQYLKVVAARQRLTRLYLESREFLENLYPKKLFDNYLQTGLSEHRTLDEVVAAEKELAERLRSLAESARREKRSENIRSKAEGIREATAGVEALAKAIELLVAEGHDTSDLSSLITNALSAKRKAVVEEFVQAELPDEPDSDSSETE